MKLNMKTFHSHFYWINPYKINHSKKYAEISIVHIVITIEAIF